MDAREVIIREAVEADADALLQLARQIDDETRFMMYEPGERQTTIEEQRQRLRAMRASGNATMLVAEQAGQLVGYLGASGGQHRRNRHSVHLWIGIRQAYAGQGLGTRLFQEVERWARQHGLHRLELTVMTHNAAGLALYRKMGFEIEGTLRHSVRVDGVFTDEYQMGKLLG
jgi:RimJ/RimL family protein N-acetyltransferase